MAEKTEKASPKKLRDARKKGQVAKSQDLPAAFTFIASIAIVLGMSGYIYSYLGDFLISAFNAVGRGNAEQSIVQLFYQAIIIAFLASIPVVATVTLIGVVVTFLSVGPVWAPEVFKFDIKKFNPVDNLKQKFKLKTLVELVKSCLKIGIAGYIIYDVMYSSLPVLMKTASMPIVGALLD
jgi:type III secretion protein U